MKFLKISSALVPILCLTACATKFQDIDTKWCPPEQLPVEKTVAAVEIAPQATPIPVPSIQKERINIAADTLFYFDKFEINDMLPKGKMALDELVSKLQNNYIEIEQIDLIGHTDRLGSEGYNFELGLKRAETVKYYLQSKGINAVIISASKGKNEPLVTCDDISEYSALKACLQPNRRVVIEISGLRTLKKIEEVPAAVAQN